MTTPEPLRLGLAGCGRIAERGYLPALRRLPDVRLAAVADPVAARRARVAPGLPGFASVEELVAAGGIEAVIVATPAERHVADARAVAAVGLHALVEKPPALGAAGARALAELAPEPALGLDRRFDRRLARLAARTTELERPLQLELRFHAPLAAWGAYEAVRLDVLLDLGPHVVDLARLLGGRVLAVRAPLLEHDRAELELELEDGTAAVSLSAVDAYEEAVAVTGAGRVARGGIPRRVRERLLPASRRALPAGLARQLAAFALYARGDDPGPLALARDGVALLETLEAARMSAADGGLPVWIG